MLEALEDVQQVSASLDCDGPQGELKEMIRHTCDRAITKAKGR